MWLTTIRFRRPEGAVLSVRVREALEAHNIESRPVWKPMHQQPVFAGHESYLTGGADRVFSDGLCLPSGVGLQERDVQAVVRIIRNMLPEHS